MDQKQIEQGKKLIKSLYQPSPDSHKGQNGKVMVIGGSHLFHAASLWALKVVSRMVDMTFYSSVPENNEIVQKEKEEFRDGIIVPREQIESYIEESDSILIGPGLERTQETKELSEKLFKKYPTKKWVIDAGSLQMMEPEWMPENAIVTPHHKEFETLEIKDQKSKIKMIEQNLKIEDRVKLFAEEYNCVVLLKGLEDIIASKDQLQIIKGGNAGMTKGGTGDVLAGLVVGSYAKNEAFKSAVAASFLNKLAGERLFEKMGYMYNASDLVEEIPFIYKACLEV